MTRTKNYHQIAEAWDKMSYDTTHADSAIPEEDLRLQAERLELLLPSLVRWLYTLTPNHPSIELPLAQLRVCNILSHGSRTLSSLSEELGVTVSAITQIADRLERAGLVERTTGEEDRRTRLLSLSKKGEQDMRERHILRIDRAEIAMGKLPANKRKALLQAMQHIMHAVSTE